MATPVTINPSYSRKVQLEQFEPIEVGVEMEVALENDDNPDEVYDEYAERAEDMVERQLAERVAQQKIDADE